MGGWSADRTFVFVTFLGFGPLLLSLVLTALIGVLIPVAIAEGRDLAGSMVRAWRLTEGSRWKIFALWAIVQTVLQLDGLVSTGLWLFGRAHPQFESQLFLEWTNSAFSHAVDAFWWVLIAAAYLEIRRIREGASEDQVAELFA